MANKTVITTDTFSTVLRKIVTNDNKMAASIQELIMFGLLHYNEHNDSVYLTQIMNAGFKSVRTEAIKVYIQDHTNLMLRKDGEDAVKFKIDKQSTSDRFTQPEQTWAEYSKIGQAVPVDADTLVKRTIAALTKAIEGEGKRPLKEGTKDHAKIVLANLKDAAAASGIELAA